MIHTDGENTISNRVETTYQRVLREAESFANTLREIESLPAFDENAAWEDEHRYDHDEVD